MDSFTLRLVRLAVGESAQVGSMSSDNGSERATRGERRQDKRRRKRKMGVSGKSFVNAVRNAAIKRKAEIEVREREQR